MKKPYSKQYLKGYFKAKADYENIQDMTPLVIAVIISLGIGFILGGIIQ